MEYQSSMAEIFRKFSNSQKALRLVQKIGLLLPLAV